MVSLCRQFLAFLLAVLLTNVNSVPHGNGLDVFIFGGAGDLAKRYLWKGFFKLYRDELNWSAESMRFYGTGRKSPFEICKGGKDPIKEILKEGIDCGEDALCCEKDKNSFVNQSKYIQVKTDDHYQFICEVVQTSPFAEHDVIFYLSVPPSSYQKIIERISSHCDLNDRTHKYKFVFEKPFGTHYDSAVALSVMLEKHLNESQIYRVDHYLGKTATAQILQFRQENPSIEKFFHHKYIRRVEIIAKETVGAEDRIPYYDDSGVIRDMLQSHLTEILSLLAMDVAKQNGKLMLLKDVVPVKTSDVLLGQYNGYAEEVFDKTGTLHSNTPTFAVTRVAIRSARWRSVPFVLLSGKKMDARVGYARILFKDTLTSNTTKTDCNKTPQIVFYIGHGQLKTPAILVSSLLPMKQNHPEGWAETSRFDDLQLFGTLGRCFRIFVPELPNEDAYSFLIAKLYRGDQRYFVPLRELLQSWQIWTPVLKSLSKSRNIKKYAVNSSEIATLKYKVTPSGLKFACGSVRLDTCLPRNIFVKKCDPDAYHTMFLGCPAAVGPEDVITQVLAEDFREAVLSVNGNDFHLALSGGSSPVSLYSYMATNLSASFPWQKIHFWQVDERCSPEHSNFVKLKSLLIDKVPGINQSKVHPMLTPANGFECNESSASVYEDSLYDLTAQTRDDSQLPVMDFVVLGMGVDGHTASLFPGSRLLDEDSRAIAVEDYDEPGMVSPKRMTLTFRAINHAKHIAVIVKGQQKCQILQEIAIRCAQKHAGLQNDLKYPICRVRPENGRVKWYISNMSCPTHGMNGQAFLDAVRKS